jgi:hypothetical protein
MLACLWLKYAAAFASASRARGFGWRYSKKRYLETGCTGSRDTHRHVGVSENASTWRHNARVEYDAKTRHAPEKAVTFCLGWSGMML